MKKINELNILSLKMEGFKRFKDTYEVRMDEITCISGANGEGKSSIADAIAFAFFGTNFWGERDYERFKNPFCNEMKVSVQFVDGDGELHTLTRTRTGDTTTVILDSQQMNQSDIPAVFAERDIFLSIFNPLYFIEKIASDGRSFLQKLLPTVENSQVLEKMSESTRVLIENEDIGVPEIFVKNRRAVLKDTEKTCDYLEGQIDLLKTQRQEAIDSLDSVIENGNAIVAQKEELEKRQFEGIDVEALKARLAQLSLDVDSRRAELLAKKAEAENRQYVSKCLDKMAELKSEITALSGKSKVLAERIKGIKAGDTCPTCGTVVTEGNYTAIITSLRKEYNLVCEKGKNAMAAYKELEQIETSSRTKFEEFKAEDIKKAEADLSMLGDDASETKALETKIRLGNLTEEEYTRLCELQKKAEDFAKEVDKLCESDKIPIKIEEIEKNLADCKKKMESNNAIIKAVVDFAAKRAEMTLASLKMNRAAIKLTDVSRTTGEVKDVFKFTYDNKDYRCLSASEKIRAGLEVSELLARLTGLSYPTYIDNAECITNKLDMVSGQVMLAYARTEALNVQCRKKQMPVREAA
ncbi:MAG: AAA family ATPase [Eubacteriales bacterium]|nr:AAA family ATPase [Eubacteriales bacterium]